MPGILYAKVNGQWVPAAPEEVRIGDTDPGVGSGDIWVDTSTVPPSLKANVGGVWTTITAGAETEVSIGPEDPYVLDPTLTEGTVELWHDTTLDPGTMKARVAGLWQVIAGSDEMSVGALDPITVNPRRRSSSASTGRGRRSSSDVKLPVIDLMGASELLIS